MGIRLTYGIPEHVTQLLIYKINEEGSSSTIYCVHNQEMNMATTILFVVAVIVLIMITTIIPETNATATQIDHKKFEVCFKNYAPSLEKILSVNARQLIEDNIRSGRNIDINNIRRNDNVYNCVHGLPIHPEIDLTTGKFIK